jgi:hypothetical protein
MGIFDVNTYLDATTTEALKRRPPLPAGTEFIGTLGEPKGRDGEKDGKPWRAVDFPVEIDLTAYPDLAKLTGADKLTFKYGFFLEVNEGGMIDWSVGKNAGLRRLREATGQNVPGKEFNIRLMQGRRVRVKIGHRPYEGEVFDEIASIAQP